MRIEKHEQVGCTVPAIFAIVTLRLDHGVIGIGWFGMEIEHILHPCDIGVTKPQDVPHVSPPPGLQLVLNQSPARYLP
jgi:hypothetical protein